MRQIVLDTETTGLDPRTLTIAPKWADPSTRSAAQEADAVVKLHAEGLIPQEYALARLGYTDEEIAKISQTNTPDRG